MTEKILEQGVELQRSINALRQTQKNLDDMKKLCLENMSIEKRTTHSFTIKATSNDGGSIEIIEVSARAAYTAVFEELEKIEKNLKELTKEFFDL